MVPWVRDLAWHCHRSDSCPCRDRDLIVGLGTLHATGIANQSITIRKYFSSPEKNKEQNEYPCSYSPTLFSFNIFTIFALVFFCCCCLFVFFRAAPAAYGDSQARGLIRVFAAGLCQSHSNARSELCLQPTLQLTATLDP